MKIGDRVFVHGYVDEIRKDTIIIRNKGGYFGTDKSEVLVGEMPKAKTGTWVKPKRMHTFCQCSVCGIMPVRGRPNFCPNCGADMREPE